MQLTPQLQSMLNDQIKREYIAGFTYIELANVMDALNFPNFSAFFDKAAKEEFGHADTWTAYLRDRGRAKMGVVSPAITSDIASPLQAFTAALSLEREVSKAIGELDNAAQAAHDGATERLVHEFLDEQRKSEREFEVFVADLQRVGEGPSLVLYHQEFE